MNDLSHEEIQALIAEVKEMTKSVDRRFVPQALICAAADLLIEKATCDHLDCLNDHVANLHQLLDAHVAIAAYEKGYRMSLEEVIRNMAKDHKVRAVDIN